MVYRAPLNAPGGEPHGTRAIPQWRWKRNTPRYRHTGPGLGTTVVSRDVLIGVGGGGWTLSRTRRSREGEIAPPEIGRVGGGFSDPPPVTAWLVKPRRAPPRHCRDARVYGHTTTAIHDNECIPCPPRHCRDARVYGQTTTAMHEIEYISPLEYTPPLPSPVARAAAPGSQKRSSCS